MTSKSKNSLMDELENFRNEQLENRYKIRSTSEALKSPIITAHDDAERICVQYFRRAVTLQKSFNPARSNEMHLIAQWLQGNSFTRQALYDGLYAQGASLLRQELEILTAIKEARGGRRKDGKTPNVGNAISEMRFIYGELSDIAHCSQQELVGWLTEYQNAVTSIPRFNEEAFLKLVGWRAIVSIKFFDELLFQFEAPTNEDDKRLIHSFVDTLTKCGVIKDR